MRGFLGRRLSRPCSSGEDVGELERIGAAARRGWWPAAAPARCRRSGGVPRRGRRASTRPSGPAGGRLGPDDLSDLIFTSGTTGYPKGATTTHAQTLRTFGTWAVHRRPAPPGDRYLVVNPFFHTFGYKAGILACLMTGATMVPEPVFDVGRVMERIAAERITVLPGPPTFYQSLLADPGAREYDLSSLRLGVTGAAVVPVELVHAMRRRARVRDRADRLRPDRVDAAR